MKQHLISVPADRKYSIQHLWVFPNGKLEYSVGITSHLLNSMKRINQIEFEEEGVSLSTNEKFCTITGEKGSVDLVMPFSGIIIIKNVFLTQHLSVLHNDPINHWLVILAKNPRNPNSTRLLSSDEYQHELKDQTKPESKKKSLVLD